MLNGVKASISLFISLMIVLWFSGCAKRTFLMVNYQVPEASQELEGQVVHFRVTDQRPAESILTTGAAYKLPDFSGYYSLAWIMPDQQRILAGEHHLLGLFKTVFEKRVTELGGETTDSSETGIPTLTIILKQATIDLQDHEWKADLNYEAILSLAGHPTAKESIQGSAQRVRIIGSKGAEKILGDIFSDVVNRLDMPKLFRNARLIP